MPVQRLTVGVARERDERERRVALMPDGVARLGKAELDVVVEAGAGESAGVDDAAYVAAGATVVPDVYALADVTVHVTGPDLARVRPDLVSIGLLAPLADPDRVARLATAQVTAVSLDCLPRTLSRAQAMDALTSQASLAGYKAALLAADSYDGFFPLLMTAAGTTRPASVLVLGAGVAGLQALATARRLGAVTTGYDVRDVARGDVLSTGAAFLDLGVTATGEGGYARALTDQERQAQQDALAEAVAKFDVVITTAHVPGRRPPVLLPAAALAGMRSGSVVIDLAAGPLGGNVDGSVPDSTVTTANGVQVIGAGNLPSAMPRTASTAYSRNLTNLLAHLVRDGQLVLDLEDEITGGVVVTHNGKVVHPGVAAALRDRLTVPA